VGNNNIHNATSVMIIKAAWSELGCLQALHLAHVYSVLCSAALKILRHISNEFLPLTTETGRDGYGSHPASTNCMLTATAGTRLCGATLLSVSLDIIFSFVTEMLVMNFLGFLCLITDRNLFSWVSLFFCLPALPPHLSDEGSGQPLHKKEMIRSNEPPEDTIFTLLK